MRDGLFLFDTPLEWSLAGRPDIVARLLQRVADELRFGSARFSVRPARLLGSAMDGLGIYVHQGAEAVATGVMQLEELPHERTRLRVPPGRGSTSPTSWPADPDGRLFSTFLNAALAELRASGLIPSSSRFHSRDVLDTARRELDAAEDSAAFAAIGNICRSAMVALANELYAPHMSPAGHEQPKGDDADTKLKLVLAHYFGGRSERYCGGFNKNIEGSWETATALSHRKSATKEEAEACLVLVTALFEAFSFIVPS